MNRKAKKATLEEAAKARVVRAFYDAADRLHDLSVQQWQSPDVISDALKELSDVIVKARNECSDEFAEELQAASERYFDRIEKMNRGRLN